MGPEVFTYGMVALNYSSKPVVNQRFYDFDVLSVDATLFSSLPTAEPRGEGRGVTLESFGCGCAQTILCCIVQTCSRSDTKILYSTLSQTLRVSISSFPIPDTLL